MKRNKGVVSATMRNHNIVFLLVAIIALTGIYGLFEMNKDEFPQFTIRQGVVAGIYPGATSEEVEQQLTKPLENFLFTYSEIDKTKTYSYSQDGMVYIFVELNKNVHNKNEAWSKLRHGLKDFKMQLPAEVLAVVVLDDFGNTVSMLITMESADKSQRELGVYMDNLCDRLRKIESMGNIKTIGTNSEEISVYVEQEKLAMYGINSQLLFANLYTQGFTTTSGTIDMNNFTAPIYISNLYGGEKEIEEQIVYSDPEGRTVRLRDIARVERRYTEPSSYVTKDGNRALVLSLEMRPDNDIVAFGKEVEQKLEEFKSEIPPSVNLYRITNQPKVVADSVWSFLRDLIFAILIVIGVMLMLFPLRSALVAGTGIPICTAITLAIMYFTGMEINTVTLASLITVLGMIVDNSIVMIDGYIERINRGMSRWHSAIASANELFFPLFMATVAISGMFFPVRYILTGAMQDFVKLFPWTIAISLLVSLAYAVLVIPYLEFSFIKLTKTDKQTWLDKLQNRFFKNLQNGYEWILNKCFKHPYITLLLGVGSIALALVIFSQLNIQMMPKAERNVFAVEINLPMGSTLESTASVSDSLEFILKSDSRIEEVTAFVGTSSPRFHATYAPSLPGTHFAQFIVNTASNNDTEDILQEYSKKYANYFPNAYVRFKQLDYQAVPNPIEVRFSGENIEDLHKQADKLMAYMHTLPDELAWIHTDCDGEIPSVSINLKTDEATRLGITKAGLSLHLATTLGGQPLTTIWEGDYAIPVKLYIDRSGKPLNYEAISNLFIPTAMGTWVPLRQVATLAPDWQPARIVRRNGVHTVTVGCDLQYGRSQPASMKKIKNYVETEIEPNLPETVKVNYGGLTEADDELIPELALSVIMALAVIFIFLLFAFAKIDIVILTLTACMLCLFGAFFGLWVLDIDFGITSVLGIVSLIGIIVRNAMIMFEYAENLRVDQKKSAFEAGLEAGKRRMRPIFLTSATTALGVIPMIISGSQLWMPMGIVICFGTIFSILFVVTILPVTYWQIYKKKSPKLKINKL